MKPNELITEEFLKSFGFRQKPFYTNQHKKNVAFFNGNEKVFWVLYKGTKMFETEIKYINELKKRYFLIYQK